MEDKLRQTQRFNTTNKSDSEEKSTSINMTVKSRLSIDNCKNAKHSSHIKLHHTKSI